MYEQALQIRGNHLYGVLWSGFCAASEWWVIVQCFCMAVISKDCFSCMQWKFLSAKSYLGDVVWKSTNPFISGEAAVLSTPASVLVKLVVKLQNKLHFFPLTFF